jgi:hypothetical protein
MEVCGQISSSKHIALLRIFVSQFQWDGVLGISFPFLPSFIFDTHIHPHTHTQQHYRSKYCVGIKEHNLIIYIPSGSTL